MPAATRYFVLVDGKTILDRVSVFSSEFVSMIIFTSVVCFTCVSKMWMSFQYTLLHLALGNGFALLMAVQFGSHISGGHVNPIVTLAACILGKKALVDFPLYILAQLSGGLIGYFLVWLNTAPFYRKAGDVNICSPGVHPELYPTNGLLTEFFASFILILVYCGMWDSRNRMHLDAIAVKLAFVVICEVLAFYFIFGQLMGGICGATIYRLLFALPYDDEMEPWIQ